MTTPKISVLMPAYNAEKYIGEAIESILGQTFNDFEFIIIDDGSSDRTWEIVQSFAAKDARIIAHRNEKNLGISGTRNKLISLSRAEYLVWQDADDISMPYRLEKQHQFMEANPEIGIVGGFLDFFDEKRKLGVRKYDSDDVSLRKKIFRYSIVAQPAAMVRRSALLDAEMFPQFSVAEDLAVLFKIGTMYRFANLQEVLLRYRVNSSSATFKRIKEMEKMTFSLRKKYSQHKAYNPSFFDFVYNVVQFMSVYLIPGTLRIAVFNFFRNSRP